MAKEQGITLGEWEVRQLPVTKGFQVSSPDHSFTGISDRVDLPNLIARAMNECQLVNKNHPEYVAENIERAFRTLRDIYAHPEFAYEITRKFLTDIEKGL